MGRIFDMVAFVIIGVALICLIVVGRILDAGRPGRWDQDGPDVSLEGKPVEEEEERPYRRRHL